MYTRDILFQKQHVTIAYRDDSDMSVIDEFFVDKMYRSLESIISNIQYPILDIGAHIGVFSLYAHILNQKIKIIALEPHPDNVKLFQKNISLNNIQNIELLPYALTHTPETTTTLLVSENTHNHTISQEHTNTSAQKQIKVPAITLEKLIKQSKLDTIGLLKIDIEGAEFGILENMRDVWNKIQHIAVEYHDDQKNKHSDLEEIMRQNGFSVEHFPNKFDKRFGLLVGRNKRIN